MPLEMRRRRRRERKKLVVVKIVVTTPCCWSICWNSLIFSQWICKEHVNWVNAAAKQQQQHQPMKLPIIFAIQANDSESGSWQISPLKERAQRGTFSSPTLSLHSDKNCYHYSTWLRGFQWWWWWWCFWLARRRLPNTVSYKLANKLCVLAAKSILSISSPVLRKISF